MTEPTTKEQEANLARAFYGADPSTPIGELTAEEIIAFLFRSRGLELAVGGIEITTPQIRDANLLAEAKRRQRKPRRGRPVGWNL